MADVSSIWTHLYRSISSSPSRPRRPIEIPPEHVEPSRPPQRPADPRRDTVGAPARPARDEVRPQKDYVSIVLNQLFLADARKWFTAVEPTVFASTEFLYAGGMRTDPVVIGPRPNEGLPRGMALRNMTVFGPHPYRGGPLTFTFVLSQLPAGNVARNVLDVIEATSGALVPTLGIEIYTRMGNVVLDGFQKLMGLNGMTPLIGLRETVNPDAGQALRTGHWALIDVDDPDPFSFWVVQDELLHGSDRRTAKPFRQADFILYEIATASDGRRSDVDALPINATWKAALDAASRGSEDAWKEAKANLGAMIGAIAASPDLTWEHGQALVEERLAMLIALRDQSRRVAMAADQKDPLARVRERIADVLALP